MKCAVLPKALALGAFITILIGCAENQGVSVPIVTGITPSALTSSTLPRTVMVSGANFQPGAGSYAHNLLPAQRSRRRLRIMSASFQITAVFATGNCTIAVTNPGGENSSPFNFMAKLARASISRRESTILLAARSLASGLAQPRSRSRTSMATENLTLRFRTMRPIPFPSF